MMMMMNRSFPILAIVVAGIITIVRVDSFVVESPITTHAARTWSTTSTTTLNLVPAQGKQLEAAMNAAYASAAAKLEDPEEEGDAHGGMSTLTTTAQRPSLSETARAFVSRVFSLPSSIIRGHPHPKLEGFDYDDDDLDHHDDHDDVVLFPLIGFQFVQGGVLPSSKSCNPSCRLPTDRDEELVGWFSKACHLQPLDADDYCQPPSHQKSP